MCIRRHFPGRLQESCGLPSHHQHGEARYFCRSWTQSSYEHMSIQFSTRNRTLQPQTSRTPDRAESYFSHPFSFCRGRAMEQGLSPALSSPLPYANSKSSGSYGGFAFELENKPLELPWLLLRVIINRRCVMNPTLWLNGSTISPPFVYFPSCNHYKKRFLVKSKL